MSLWKQSFGAFDFFHDMMQGLNQHGLFEELQITKLDVYYDSENFDLETTVQQLSIKGVSSKSGVDADLQGCRKPSMAS